MHVLSLHNSAKFGCFYSINDKIINNLPWCGCFQPNFWWPLAAKVLMDPKKVWVVKWWHEPPTSIIMQNLVESNHARRREKAKYDVFHFLLIDLFMFVTLVAWRPSWWDVKPYSTTDLVGLLQREIALVFVAQFRWGLQHFFGWENPFHVSRTDLKIVARWRYNTCRNAREIFKIWENGSGV